MNPTACIPALPADDLERARDFYANTLGMKVSEGTAGITVGEGQAQLFVFVSTGRSSGTFTQVGIQVDDVRATVAELRSRGVRFEEYDTPGLQTKDGIATTPDGSAAAWFKDSEGNLLSIVPSQ